jgi:hypothetical protein
LDHRRICKPHFAKTAKQAVDLLYTSIETLSLIYLLAILHTKITQVELFDTEECMVNQETEGEIQVPGFGAADCKNHCGSHLKYLG